MTNREAPYNQGCVALGAKRACHRVCELRLLAACKTLALYQRRDVQATLVESCLQAIPMASHLRAILTCSQGPELASSAFCLSPSLPCEMGH